MMMDAPVAVVCGHYGVGKTNLTLNIALDAAAGGRAVTVIDLDVVNPFFRSSDYRALLDERGIRLVAPVFAGTNVDGPSLSGTIEPAIDGAQRAWRDGDERPFVVIDEAGFDAFLASRDHRAARHAGARAERDHHDVGVVGHERLGALLVALDGGVALVALHVEVLQGLGGEVQRVHHVMGALVLVAACGPGLLGQRVDASNALYT